MMTAAASYTLSIVLWFPTGNELRVETGFVHYATCMARGEALAPIDPMLLASMDPKSIIPYVFLCTWVPSVHFARAHR